LLRVSSSLTPVIRYGLGEAITYNTVFQGLSQDKLYIYVQATCIYLCKKKAREACADIYLLYMIICLLYMNSAFREHCHTFLSENKG
jgi:hypothetical protein